MISFGFRYAYHRHESDATFQPVFDADFGSGIGLVSDSGDGAIDVDGQELKAICKVTSNCSLNLIMMMMMEEIEGGSDESNLYFFDVMYKV